MLILIRLVNPADQTIIIILSHKFSVKCNLPILVVIHDEGKS